MPTEVQEATSAATAVAFTVGGVGVRLASEDPALPAVVCRETEYFRTPGAPVDSEVHAAFGRIGNTAPGPRIFDSGGLWQLYRDGGTDYVFRFHSPAYGPLPYKEARFRGDFSAGEVILQADYFDPAHTAFPLEYPLDELLVVHLLSLGRGVEVHACGIEDRDGRGYLFLGQSGAGKSTTARLWTMDPDVKILSDDRIILRHEGGRIWMYGTPWHGEAEMACAMRTPLSGIFFPGRGAKNELIPLAQPEAVSRTLACSFVPFYSVEGLAWTLEMLRIATAAVPAAEYRFVPDRGAVDFIRERAA